MGEDDDPSLGEGGHEEGWIDWLKRTAKIIDDEIDRGRLVDWVQEQRRRKWRWAVHVARRDDGRWTRWMLGWVPVGGVRAPGRPVTRWEDSLNRFMQGRDKSWLALAQDREAWASLEDEFAKAGIRVAFDAKHA